MLYLIDKTPRKTALVHKLEGDVKVLGDQKYQIGDALVEGREARTLERRAGGYSSLAEAIGDKNLYLRGRLEAGQKAGWFGLVTDKFKEIRISELEEVAERLTGETARVRYSPEDERFFLKYRVGESADGSKIMLTVDSADFRTYGGNGQMAVGVGLARYNPRNDSYTIVKSDSLPENRVIHRWDTPKLEAVVNEVLGTVPGAVDLLDQAAKVSVAKEDLSQYGVRPGSTLERTLGGLYAVRGEPSILEVAEHVSMSGRFKSGSATIATEKLSGEILYGGIAAK